MLGVNVESRPMFGYFSVGLVCCLVSAWANEWRGSESCDAITREVKEQMIATCGSI
jgi:hypothetical protein